jgi:hypothetical protein
MWREVRRRVEHQLGFDAPAPPAPPGPPLPQPQIPSPSEIPQRSAVRILGPDDEPSPAEPRPRVDPSEDVPEGRAGDGADDDRDDAQQPEARQPRARRGTRTHEDEHADTNISDVRTSDTQNAEPQADTQKSGGATRDGDAKSRGTRPSRGRVLGVNVVDGVAYLMVVDASGTPLPETADRVAPPADGDSGKRLAAFSEIIARGLRSQRIDVVAVARPVRYTNWRYADAADRAALETCIALAAHANGVHFESVGQHHAANVIGLPMSRLGDLLASRLGIHKTPSWRERWPALLVALAAGQRDRSASPTSSSR